jgi:hypothetical protein
MLRQMLYVLLCCVANRCACGAPVPCPNHVLLCLSLSNQCWHNLISSFLRSRSRPVSRASASLHPLPPLLCASGRSALCVHAALCAARISGFGLWSLASGALASVRALSHCPLSVETSPALALADPPLAAHALHVALRALHPSASIPPPKVIFFALYCCVLCSRVYVCVCVRICCIWVSHCSAVGQSSADGGCRTAWSVHIVEIGRAKLLSIAPLGCGGYCEGAPRAVACCGLLRSRLSRAYCCGSLPFACGPVWLSQQIQTRLDLQCSLVCFLL